MKPNLTPRRVRRGLPRGYTLVELLVSSAILAISIVSIVAMIRKGRELDSTDGHRRRVRAIIDSCFESDAYQPANYGALAGAANVSVVVEPSGYGRASNLTGSLSVTLTPAAAEDSVAANGGIFVHFRQVTASVVWTEPEGSQTLTLAKRLTAQ